MDARDVLLVPDGTGPTGLGEKGTAMEPLSVLGGAKALLAVCHSYIYF